MIETLKKQWFVVLIAIIFIGFTVFIIFDTNKDKLPGKSVDGKDVIASIDGADITADQLYDNMYSLSGGNSLVYLRFQSAVVDASIKETDEIKETTKQIQDYVTQQAQSQAQSVGMSADDYITATISKNGFHADEFEDYCRVQAKLFKMHDDYLAKHMDELFRPMAEKNDGRIVSHILVMMKDAKNPTEEEMKVVKQIEKDLETMSFAEVAKKHAATGDGSAKDGGYLGYMDKNTQFVDSFKKQALSMEKGEVSGWVKESNQNYNGWHLIKVEETDVDAMLKDKKAKDSINQAINMANPDLTNKMITDAMKKLDIKYANKDVQKEIESFLNVK